MNVSFNKIDDVNGVITVTLEDKDFADKVKAQLKEIGRQRPEKGFRPGKTPLAIMEKKYGKSVRFDVVNREVSDALYNYIKDNDIDVLGNPIPEAGQNIDVDAPEISVKFKVALAPAIDINVDKNLHVPYYEIKVSKEMLDSQIASLQRQFGAQVPTDEFEPDALVKGVITELNPDGGGALEGGIVQQTGIVYPKYFKDEDQKKLFDGAKVGDAIVFNPWKTCNGDAAELSSMLNVSKEQAPEIKNDFEINITEMITLKPAQLDQEFFDNVLGKDVAHNEEEFRQAVQKNMEAGLANDSNYRFTIDAKDALIKAAGDVKIPDEVLKEYLISQNENLTADNIEEEYVKIRPQLLWQIISLDLMKKLDIKVSDEDMLNVARSMARQQFARYGMNNVPAENLDKYARELVANERTRNQIYEAAVNSKLFNAVRASVTLDEKQVSLDDFNALFHQGEVLASEETES